MGFASVVRGHGARPALAFLPDRDDGRDDRRRRGWLNAWAAEHGVPFLDLTTLGWLDEGVMSPAGGGE